MNEERNKFLIEKCKNEIRRYSHLVKTFDPNEGEEMEEYQQNIQDWNDIIAVNNLALAALTAQPVKLPDLRQSVSGERYVWSDGAGNYKQDAIIAIRAAGYQVEGNE